MDQKGFGSLVCIQSLEQPCQAVDQLVSPVGALRHPLELAEELDDLPVLPFEQREPFLQPRRFPSEHPEVVVAFLAGEVVHHQLAELCDQVLWIELLRYLGMAQQDAVALQSVDRVP